MTKRGHIKLAVAAGIATILVIAGIAWAQAVLRTEGIHFHDGQLVIGSGGTIGTATGGGDLYVKDALEVDGATVLGDAAGDAITLTGYFDQLRVGTGSTPDLTLTSDNAFIEGTLEVDGAARFDANVTFGNAATDTITATGVFATDVTFDNAISGGADISVEQAAASTAGDTLDLAAGAGGTAATDTVGKNGGALTLVGGAGSAKNGTGLTGGDGGAMTGTGGAGAAGHATGGTSGAGGAISWTGGAGGTGTVETGGAGGAVSLTGGAGSNGTTTGGIGGILTLLGGAAGTGGAPSAGYVRVGSPTVGSTVATNLLAVGGAFEVDGASRFDGTVAHNSTTTFQTGDITGTEILDGTIEAADEAFAGRGQIVICGTLDTIASNTVYYGPSAVVSATAIGGMTCDTTAVGNVTEATADAPAFTAKAFHVRGMVCRNADTNVTSVSYTLRSAAAALVPAVTCSVGDGVLDCVADAQTTTAIASGATIAVAAAEADEAVGAVVFVCVIDIAY